MTQSGRIAGRQRQENYERQYRHIASGYCHWRVKRHWTVHIQVLFKHGYRVIAKSRTISKSKDLNPPWTSS